MISPNRQESHIVQSAYLQGIRILAIIKGGHAKMAHIVVHFVMQLEKWVTRHTYMKEIGKQAWTFQARILHFLQKSHHCHESSYV